MSMHHHQPTPAPAVRAPHADPFGQFRGAPLNRGRRARYSSLVFGLVLLLSGLPFLLDASLPAAEPTQEDANAVMETNLANTYGEWKLRFGALDDQCSVTRNFVDMNAVNYDCGDWSARVTSMAGVESYDSAVATALNRSVRVLTFSDTGDMGSHQITEEALKINPDVLKASEAKDIWMSDPYRNSGRSLDEMDSFGQQEGARMHNYAVGFFKPNADDDVHGMLVTVEVTAEQLDEAHEYVERVLETAKVAPGENGAEGALGGGMGV